MNLLYFSIILLILCNRMTFSCDKKWQKKSAVSPIPQTKNNIGTHKNPPPSESSKNTMTEQSVSYKIPTKTGPAGEEEFKTYKLSKSNLIKRITYSNLGSCIEYSLEEDPLYSSGSEEDEFKKNK